MSVGKRVRAYAEAYGAHGMKPEVVEDGAHGRAEGFETDAAVEGVVLNVAKLRGTV